MSSIDGFQSIELAFVPSILFLLSSNILFQMLPNSTLFYSAGDKSPFLGSNLPSLITRRKPARKTHQTYKKNCLQIAYIFQNRRNNTFFLQKNSTSGKAFPPLFAFYFFRPESSSDPAPSFRVGGLLVWTGCRKMFTGKRGEIPRKQKYFLASTVFLCFLVCGNHLSLGGNSISTCSFGKKAPKIFVKLY